MKWQKKSTFEVIKTSLLFAQASRIQEKFKKSKTVPRIWIFLIAMGSHYSFEVKTIEIWAPPLISSYRGQQIMLAPPDF